jgi:soluble lytic murein transglycosylase
LGDPRSRDVDPIDWVEQIPFSETRNYVQRVMENLQVYRHRVSGEPAEIRLQQDLRRGG